MSNDELKNDSAPELDDAALSDVTGGCGSWPPQGTAWQGYFKDPPTFPPPGWVEC